MSVCATSTDSNKPITSNFTAWRREYAAAVRSKIYAFALFFSTKEAYPFINPLVGFPIIGKFATEAKSLGKFHFADETSRNARLLVVVDHTEYFALDFRLWDFHFTANESKCSAEAWLGRERRAGPAFRLSHCHK